MSHKQRAFTPAEIERYGGKAPYIPPVLDSAAAGVSVTWADIFLDPATGMFRVGIPQRPHDGELSEPMSKAELARRVFGDNKVRARKVEPLLKQWGVVQHSPLKIRVRLDAMDPHTRAKIERKK